MLIANPILDVVFKELMENETIAKFFISTLTGEDVLSLRLLSQETTYPGESGTRVLRLDFVANVKTADDCEKKVLVEIQKAKNANDIMRFRRYLGQHYGKDDGGDGLPITTIYVLGFALPEIDSPCVKVERRYKDMIGGKIIDAKNDFMEKLTHDSFVVQTPRIGNGHANTLEKMLSVFEQRHFVDLPKNNLKEYSHEIDLKEVDAMTKILSAYCANPKKKKMMDEEREAQWAHEAWFGEQNRTIGKQGKKLETQGKQLETQGKQLKTQGKQLELKDRHMKTQEKLLQEKNIRIKELEAKLTGKKNG